MTDQAFTVASLAEKWQCSKRTIYSMIEDGSLRTFTIGRRGLRVSAEEAQRWEREREERSATGREIAPLGGAGASLLPTSAIRALASAKG